MRRYVVALCCAAGFKLRDTLAIQQQPGDLIFRGLHRGGILTRGSGRPSQEFHVVYGQRVGSDTVGGLLKCGDVAWVAVAEYPGDTEKVCAEFFGVAG